MEDFNGNKNVSEKEEGELSSDDDGDDNQPNNIKDSSHSVQTVKEYKERQVNQSSARSKGNTSHPSRIAHKDESHRGCQKSPQGVKRRYSASDYQNQPLQKDGKQASPERNEFDPDDVMNGYYSSGEKMSGDLWCMNNREASESENHRSFEKASKPIKRRNTVSSDLRHRLSRSAAQKPSSSRRSHTRSCLKSSSGKEFYLSKYKKWDQRKPSVKPECKYRGLQIQVSDRGRKEVERKVKERPFGQPMQKRHRSNHSSLRKDRLMEPREMLHSSHHLVTSTQMFSNEVCINYPPQDSNYPPTPGIPHRTLDFGRNPTYPIHQNNGYSTFPPGTHAKLYQHPPVSLPTTQLQRRSHDGSSSDVIGQTLRSIRSHESMHLYSQNATFSSNIHNYNSTSALNGPHVKPEYIHVESVSTSIFNRLGPEVRNGLSDIQPGLDKKNPRESFPETAGNMCIRNTSNRNQLVPEYAMAHNTTNKRTETTTPRPVSGSESNRKLNENLTKTKAEREKEELKKYLSELEERNQRKREQLFKELTNNCNSSNPYVPTTVLHTQFKIDKTAKGKPQSRFRIDRTSNAKPENEFRTISWTAVSDVSILYVNSSNDTLEQKEQMNPLDFRLPQIDDETTADVNLASSLSESQSKFTEPQEEAKPNETNRRHVYLSPLSMFDTYRDKQASTKGITETHDKSHMMSLAETQEKETCNKQASVLEITETHDEDHVMSLVETREEEACNKQASALEITETHDEDHVMSLVETWEKETCNKQASALEMTETHDEGYMMSSVANSNKQAYAKENTETHNENVMSPVESQERETRNKQASLEISETHDVVSSAETQEKEACNNQVFTMEIGEICKDHVMSSAGDGNRQASAKEITKTRDKNHVISPAEAWETCNKQASALESTETNEISYAADVYGACTTQAKEITESHVEGNVMTSAADGNKQASAKVNTGTHDEGCVMSPEETHAEETCNSQALKSTEMHDKEACNNPALESTKIHVKRPVVSSAAETQVCNKQDSVMESTETRDESHVMGPTEAQNEAACNKQVSALIINETHDKDCVTSSAAGTQEDGHKQDSAVEITETHDGGYVMSPAETQDGGASNKQASATGSIKIDNESGVMNCAADLQEVCNKNVSAKEITETHMTRMT